MPGPLPKDPAIRQRANRAATRATLPAEGRARRQKAPGLPPRAAGAWHELTRAWWRDVWRSPMAGEYLKADLHGLYVLADLIDRYWTEPSVGLAAEIRLQRQCFGLTPIDRRRLQWEVERVEAATRQRPPAPPEGTGSARPGAPPADDPRALLAVVS